MEVVGSTDDAAASLGLCRKLKPDLVLMDAVTKNNTSGITHTALIRKEFPDIKIVVITVLPETRIKQLISSILNKTGFDSISKFAIYALGEGLIVPALPV